MEYGYQKEAKGYSVWSLKPHTLDRCDLICYCRSRRDAKIKMEKLYIQQDKLKESGQ